MTILSQYCPQDKACQKLLSKVSETWTPLSSEATGPMTKDRWTALTKAAGIKLKMPIPDEVRTRKICVNTCSYVSVSLCAFVVVAHLDREMRCYNMCQPAPT